MLIFYAKIGRRGSRAALDTIDAMPRPSTSKSKKTAETTVPRPKRTRVVLLLIAALLASILGSVSIGGGGPILVRVATIVEIVTISAWMPIAYVMGAWGLGRMVWKWSGPLAWIARLGIGLALMLTLTHLLGVLGMLNSVSAWIVTASGIALACVGLVRDWDGIDATISACSPDAISVALWAVGLGAIGLMLVAASNPAGVLWDSEYGNYDSLSYHLELPRAWMESGRVWPMDWNVYSFLPSYIEASYAHMGLLGFAGSDGLGLASGKGEGVYAAQYLSVLLTILAALASGSVASRLATLLKLDAWTASLASGMTRTLVLTTPWMVVVGTLSYNEPAVVLLTMVAIGIAIETQWPTIRRTIGCAIVMGVACSCKPTALFLAGPIVGVALLSLVPPKSWWRVVLVGSCVGILTLLPWLIRNELAAGNPVFPQLSALFGSGHWDAGQIERYASAHTFDGGWSDRIRLLVFPDASGTTHVERFRGLTNIQWGATAPIGILGLLLMLTIKHTRRFALVSAVAVAMVLLAWMGLTHLQSRFLVPLVGVLALLGSLGITSLGHWAAHGGHRVVGIVGVLIGIMVTLLVPAILLAERYASQSQGNPNGMLIAGVGAFTGQLDSVGFEESLWWNGVNAKSHPQHANTGDSPQPPQPPQSPAAAVYLLGDATPAYIRSPVVYNTTYDDWLIGELIRQFPDDPDAWTQSLVDRGIGWVVINISEIERLSDSGWGDPDATTDRVVGWAQRLGDPVMVWGRRHRGMFALPSSHQHQQTDEVRDE